MRKDRKHTDCPACGKRDAVRHAQEVTEYNAFDFHNGVLRMGIRDGCVPDDKGRFVCLECMTTWNCVADYVSAMNTNNTPRKEKPRELTQRN
jgi:hypothetical protein